MKKVVIEGERKAAIVDAPQPRAKDNWAVVKVHVAPMCTEYKLWKRGAPQAALGHEAVGEVVEVAQPCRVRVGDRVVVQPLYPCGCCALCISGEYIHCEHTTDFAAFTGQSEGNATMMQYLVKPDWLLSPIPDDMPYERAGLALCALGPSFGAFERMAVDAFATVLITGLGPVGLGGVVNARFRGAKVIAVDSAPYRQELAAQLGAQLVLDPTDDAILEKLRAATDGRGVDCALDCSGAVPAHRLCIDATRRKGKVAFVGECSADTTFQASRDMIRKGLTLIGSWHYNLNSYQRLLHVIRDSPVVGRLVSHEVAIDDVEQAFELQEQGKTAKVLLKPWA